MHQTDSCSRVMQLELGLNVRRKRNVFRPYWLLSPVCGTPCHQKWLQLTRSEFSAVVLERFFFKIRIQTLSWISSDWYCHKFSRSCYLHHFRNLDWPTARLFSVWWLVLAVLAGCPCRYWHCLTLHVIFCTVTRFLAKVAKNGCIIDVVAWKEFRVRLIK